jgi:hypothetical protein
MDGDEEEEEQRMLETMLKMQLYNDPDNCNNLSRNIRVITHISDAQVHPDYDGFIYCFTSPAEGPTLSRMAWLQIMCLLHIITSPVPESCVLETDFLKPTFNKHKFLEKISKRIPLNSDEARETRKTRKELNAQELQDMPFDVPFVVGGDSEDEERGGGGGGGFGYLDQDDVASGFARSGAGECGYNSRRMAAGLSGENSDDEGQSGDGCVWQVTNVADIYIAMASVDYLTPASSSSPSTSSSGAACENDDVHANGGTDQEDEGTSAFWTVILKPRLCYNFVDHLHSFVMQGEREAALRGGSTLLGGKRNSKEYDDVLSMIREVVMYQHEKSPNATAYFRRPGMTNAVDPLQAIMDKCTPPSLEHCCSIFESFRSMVWHVKNEGACSFVRKIIMFVYSFPSHKNIICS